MSRMQGTNHLQNKSVLMLPPANNSQSSHNFQLKLYDKIVIHELPVKSPVISPEVISPETRVMSPEILIVCVIYIVV